MTNQPKLCIVSLYAYPLFNPAQRQSHFGGWEVRVSLIAKELAKRGQFKVSMIVWDHGQPHLEHREGVALYSWPGQAPPLQDSSDNPQDLPGHNPIASNGPVLVDNPALPEKPVLPESQTLSATPQQSEIKRRIKTNLPWQVWLPLALLYRGLRGTLRPLYWGMRGAVGSLYWGLRGALGSLYQGLRGAWGSLYYGLREALNISLNGFGLIKDYFIWKDAIAIYDEVDADIYLVPGNHNRAAEVAYYCQKRGKKYVFLAGSDIDYNPAYKADPDKLDLYGVPAYLKVYAIENASLHLVQSEHQAQLLQQGYGRSSTVIRNPIDTTLLFPRYAEAKAILWVGSSDDRVRRPDLILNLARHLPEYDFVVIMVPAIPEVHQRCLAEAKCLPNVTMVGRTPFQEVERYFAEAKLLVNTSAFEGFPNTFLQAAKYGVPIVAAKVDPGEMLSRHGCGLSCNDDIQLLEKSVRLFMTNPERYAEVSARCLEYIHTYHDKDKIIPQYEEVLASL